MKKVVLRDIKEHKILLDNGWEVYYDDALYLQDPDEIDPKELSGHADEIIGLLKLANKEFLSISRDNTMIVWSSRGKKQTTFQCADSILEIGFIKNNEMMVRFEGNYVTLFSINHRKELATFDVKIESFDKIEIGNGFLSFITSNNSLDVYSYDGSPLISFKNQDEFFTEWIFFPNDYCLTKSGKNDIKLWSNLGEEVIQLDENFRLSRDLLYIDSEYFSFVSDSDEICVYDFKGQKHASTKEDLANVTRKYIETEEKLVEQKNKNDIDDFSHVNNPGSRTGFLPSQVMYDNDIKIQDEDSRFLWNFFNRPLFGPIQKLLKKEEKSVKEYRKKMHEIKSTHEHDIQKNIEKIEELKSDIEVTKKSKKRVGYITFFFLVMGVIFAFVSYDATTQLISKGEFSLEKEGYIEDVQYYGMTLLDYETRNSNSFSDMLMTNLLVQIIAVAVISGVLFLIFLLIWITKKNHIKQLEHTKAKTEEKNNILHSSIETIRILMVKALAWLHSIDAYRFSIIKQIPVLKDQNLYSGSKAKEIIENKIKNELEAYALKECGITKDDIEFTDIQGENRREAIVLHDWSGVQDKSNSQMTKKIIDHNEMSFWSTRDGDILFAVQYIQFIFLTKDKIDVFNTYYDFMTNEYIAKQSHAYYYKDVTNMSKKDIEREMGSKAGNIPATEIKLQVSSGDSINLTVINQETKTFLGKTFLSEEDEDKDVEIQELKERREEIEADDEMDEEEKEDQLNVIDGQINSRENNSIVINESQIQELNRADMTIQNIRAQVRNHKTAESGE